MTALVPPESIDGYSDEQPATDPAATEEATSLSDEATSADWRDYHDRLSVERCLVRWRELLARGMSAGTWNREVASLRSRLLGCGSWEEVYRG